MSLQACAEIVRRGDPDRFLAAMAAPPAARRVLFPLYAFNVEVARAPWVASEPMIGEMRLQWWVDVLDEIAAGGPVRRHEVVDALAGVLDAEGAAVLRRLVARRRWDLYAEPFADTEDFADYLDATAGGLAWVAARGLGCRGGERAVRDIAWAGGLANWFLAIPVLEVRGRFPLVDGRPAAVAALAAEGLARLARSPAPKPARAAVLASWRAKPLLRQARRDPGRVAAGTLRQSEFARRLGLIVRSFAL
ncbi:MAG: squalene/phytoene synthase family protein [Rhodobacter sp.]|nr:squalene/phytoene synthase family protein [Rhodobacter sp.]